MIGTLHKIIKILKFLNSQSSKQAINPSEIIEFCENLEEFDEVLNNLKSELKKQQKINLNNVKKIDTFLLRIFRFLSEAKSTLYELEDLLRKLLANYQAPDLAIDFAYRTSQSDTPLEIAKIEAAMAPLEYLKVREEIFNFNSVYILFKLSSGFLVNDEYDGVMILNHDLSLRKKIPASEKIYFDFWNNFKKFDSDEMIFFFDEERYVLYLDINSSRYQKVYYDENIPQIYPAKTYYWRDKELIVHDGNNFYVISTIEQSLKLLSGEIVKEELPDFYNYCVDALNYNVVRAYPEEYLFIFRDREKHQIGLRNTKENTTKTIPFHDEFVYDIKIHDEYYVFIQRDKLDVRKNQRKKTEILPDPWHTFERAEFLEINNKLYVLGLMGHSSLTLSSSLALYRVTDTCNGLSEEDPRKAPRK